MNLLTSYHISRHYKYLNIIFSVLLVAVAGNKTKILYYTV